MVVIFLLFFADVFLYPTPAITLNRASVLENKQINIVAMARDTILASNSASYRLVVSGVTNTHVPVGTDEQAQITGVINI